MNFCIPNTSRMLAIGSTISPDHSLCIRNPHHYLGQIPPASEQTHLTKPQTTKLIIRVNVIETNYFAHSREKELRLCPNDLTQRHTASYVLTEMRFLHRLNLTIQSRRPHLEFLLAKQKQPNTLCPRTRQVSESILTFDTRYAQLKWRFLGEVIGADRNR